MTEDQRAKIIALLREGALGNKEIAAAVGVSPATVAAVKAHVTMGNYSRGAPAAREPSREANLAVPSTNPAVKGKQHAGAEPDVIRGGLEALLPHLRRFVRHHLEAKYGPGFERRVKQRDGRPFSETDPRALINVALDQWEKVFRQDAPRLVKQYLHSIRDLVNAHYHHHAISPAARQHAVETMRLLAVALSGEDASADFAHLGGSEKGSRATRKGASTVRRAPNGDAAALDPAELDADSALNQRVLCPGCRSKVFKVWPLGWDAHAAFACGGLAKQDPEERKREFRERFRRLFR